jgi:hypothetical protein
MQVFGIAASLATITFWQGYLITSLTYAESLSEWIPFPESLLTKSLRQLMRLRHASSRRFVSLRIRNQVRALSDTAEL